VPVGGKQTRGKRGLWLQVIWLLACALVFGAEAARVAWLGPWGRLALAWILLWPGLVVVQFVINLIDAVVSSAHGTSSSLWHPVVPMITWVAAFSISYCVWFLLLPRLVHWAKEKLG
jgi:hypothetical protein